MSDTKNRKSTWICTDPDREQYVNKLNDYAYAFIELRDSGGKPTVCYTIVDIRDYSLNELWRYCQAYYGAFEDIVNEYGFWNAFELIAECVFESLCKDQMELVRVCENKEAAVDAIAEWIEEDPCAFQAKRDVAILDAGIAAMKETKRIFACS